MVELTSILVIVNICVSALSPIFQMFNRVKKSECLGSKIEMTGNSPSPPKREDSVPPPVKHGK
jgi:hypothetical protein